jgi:hypothetical protein
MQGINNSNDYRAQNIKDAYRVCDVRPLEEAEELAKYYYDLSGIRYSQAIGEVSFILDNLRQGENKTILFTGHRGSGKTTELKKITDEWSKNYFIIFFNADEELNINDARYTDLYLAIIKQVESQLRHKGIGLDKKLMETFADWFKEITNETEETVERSISIEGSMEGGTEIPFLAKLWLKILAQIKGSEKQKRTIRQTLDEDISRLQADINALLRDGAKKLIAKYPEYKGILIVVDNLDRVPPPVGDHLFFDYGSQLQQLDCNIIYTVPISVVYSTKNIGNIFEENPHILPMVHIYNFDQQSVDLEYTSEGLEAMTSVIAKRVNVDLVFASQAELREIAKASGGHVRQLMRIMRTACQSATTNRRSQINMVDVEYGIKQEQFQFERLIPEEHYAFLAEVCRSKNLKKTEKTQDMLYNLSVLEYIYMTARRWNYVNPVVKNSELFQQALQEI